MVAYSTTGNTTSSRLVSRVLVGHQDISIYLSIYCIYCIYLATVSSFLSSSVGNYKSSYTCNLKHILAALPLIGDTIVLLFDTSSSYMRWKDSLTTDSLIKKYGEIGRISNWHYESNSNSIFRRKENFRIKVYICHWIHMQTDIDIFFFFRMKYYCNTIQIVQCK